MVQQRKGDLAGIWQTQALLLLLLLLLRLTSSPRLHLNSGQLKPSSSL
jgi:hypothetical protein